MIILAEFMEAIFTKLFCTVIIYSRIVSVLYLMIMYLVAKSKIGTKSCMQTIQRW